MIIPEEEGARRRFLQYVIETCTDSQSERRALYDKRRRYYLYGQNKMQIVRFNRLKSHMPLLASFLYASDQIAYSVAAPKNADEKQVAAYLALEDDWNEGFQDFGLADTFDQALLWSLVYDTKIIKLGWNDVTDTMFSQLIEPSSFGVFREDTWDFTSQQAMVHSYILDWDDAVERLIRAGKGSQIEKLQPLGGGDGDTGLPGTLNQMIISATGGANLMGNIQGEVNPNYEESPSYAAKINSTMVRFHEAWVWDTKAADWRIFHMTEPDIILSDSRETIRAIKAEGSKRAAKYDSETNLFMKHENPFVPITPFPIYNYFWGDCHLEDLIPLQVWSTERLDQIGEILDTQADPPKDFTGFMGMDDERASAWGAAGTYVYDQMPGAKSTIHYPQMPEDLFREFEQIGAMFMEQSGFTEIMSGKGEKNVRGRGHARELKQTGGGRVRKVASGLERPLVRLGDLGIRLKAHNDDTPLRDSTGMEFVAAQILDDAKYTMRVAGHSHSPLFTSENQELASLLFKAQSIDREWLIRLLRPPMEANLLHSLKQRVKAEQQVAAKRMAAGMPEHNAGKSKPRAVG